jgi:transposase-like protein
VIDYETFARIRDCRDRQGLTITQIARTLGLHRQTVAKWLARSRFERPRPIPRASLLDPFKGRITRLTPTPIAPSRSSSACVKKDTVAAPRSCATMSVAFAHPSCPSISSCTSLPASVRRSTGEFSARSQWATPAAGSLLRHRARLQPIDVRRAHRLADDGAFPFLP